MDEAGLSEARAVSKATQPPLWLLAELTYRCPLHCVFCSNPVDYTGHSIELATDDWLRVLREARALGAVQLGLSGGEPLLREDLEILIGEARRLGFYTNLITSGVGLTQERIAAFKQAGLDHIQLSFQDSTRELNDFLSSTRTFELKSRVAALIKRHGYPMVLNCVLHRYNLPHVERIIEMAEAMGAEFLELANTQYYGWAWLNRDALLPTRAQIEQAEAVVDRHRERLAGKMKIFWVSPDYFDAKPKPCMAGWGAVAMVIAPDGAALPCHSARMLPGIDFPSVREHALREIWADSDAFNRYRGTDWMDPTCLQCDQHEKDRSGCRCQAYLYTGRAEAMDPVCPKSPERPRVDAAIDAAIAGAPALAAAAAATAATEFPLRFVAHRARHAGLRFRTDDNSRQLASTDPGAQAV